MKKSKPVETNKVSTNTNNEKKKSKKRLGILLGITIPLAVAGATAGIVLGVKGCSKSSDRTIVITDGSGKEIDTINVLQKTTSSGIEITLTPKDETKKVFSITTIYIGDQVLQMGEDKDYTFDASTGKIVIKKSVIDSNSGEIKITPVLTDKKVSEIKLSKTSYSMKVGDKFKISATLKYELNSKINWGPKSGGTGKITLSSQYTMSGEETEVTATQAGTVTLQAQADSQLAECVITIAEATKNYFTIDSNGQVKLNDAGLAETGTITIPATVDGKAVKGIVSGGFKGAACSAVVFAANDNLTTIENNAFTACPNITSITFANTMKPWHISDGTDNQMVCVDVPSDNAGNLTNNFVSYTWSCSAIEELYLPNDQTSPSWTPSEAKMTQVSEDYFTYSFPETTTEGQEYLFKTIFDVNWICQLPLYDKYKVDGDTHFELDASHPTPANSKIKNLTVGKIPTVHINFKTQKIWLTEAEPSKTASISYNDPSTVNWEYGESTTSISNTKGSNVINFEVLPVVSKGTFIMGIKDAKGNILKSANYIYSGDGSTKVSCSFTIDDWSTITSGDTLTVIAIDAFTTDTTGKVKMTDTCKEMTGTIQIPELVDGLLVTGVAMNGCFGSKATSITFADSQNITHIDTNAFYECPNLTSFIIPASVTYIGYGAFAGCDACTSIEFDDGENWYQSRTTSTAVVPSSSSDNATYFTKNTGPDYEYDPSTGFNGKNWGYSGLFKRTTGSKSILFYSTTWQDEDSHFMFNTNTVYVLSSTSKTLTLNVESNDDDWETGSISLLNGPSGTSLIHKTFDNPGSGRIIELTFELSDEQFAALTDNQALGFNIDCPATKILTATETTYSFLEGKVTFSCDASYSVSATSTISIDVTTTEHFDTLTLNLVVGTELEEITITKTLTNLDAGTHTFTFDLSEEFENFDAENALLFTME